MADQISVRRARTLSIEENSFIIVYNQVNINRKYCFASAKFLCCFLIVWLFYENYRLDHFIQSYSQYKYQSFIALGHVCKKFA
jgi:hypothetical protein